MLEMIREDYIGDVEMNTCSHSQRFFYRQLWKSGGGFHIVEWCPACRCNYRGAGVYVPQAEVLSLGHRIDELPFLPTTDQQPGLFDSMEFDG